MVGMGGGVGRAKEAEDGLHEMWLAFTIFAISLDPAVRKLEALEYPAE